MTKFVALRPKTYSYTTYGSNEKKNTKSIKNCATNRELKFEGYSNCLGANRLENKINYSENSEIDVESLKQNHKVSLKDSRLILKSKCVLKMYWVLMAVKKNTINKLHRNACIWN